MIWWHSLTNKVKLEWGQTTDLPALYSRERRNVAPWVPETPLDSESQMPSWLHHWHLHFYQFKNKNKTLKNPLYTLRQLRVAKTLAPKLQVGSPAATCSTFISSSLINNVKVHRTFVVCSKPQVPHLPQLLPPFPGTWNHFSLRFMCDLGSLCAQGLTSKWLPGLGILIRWFFLG